MPKALSFFLILLLLPGLYLSAQEGSPPETPAVETEAEPAVETETEPAVETETELAVEMETEPEEYEEIPPVEPEFYEPYIGFYAPEEPEEDEEEEDFPLVDSGDSESFNYNFDLYGRGDKIFVISMGVLFPTIFRGNVIQNNDHGLSLGGTGSLGYNFFLTPNVYVGGEISGMFAGTRGNKMLYIIPIGARIGYQFLFRRFEFPLSIFVGAAPQKYLGESYFGLVMKGGASVFWRYNPDWSFGVNAAWWLVPQWPKNGQNAYGNFMEFTLSVRYHN